MYILSPEYEVVVYVFVRMLGRTGRTHIFAHHHVSAHEADNPSSERYRGQMSMFLSAILGSGSLLVIFRSASCPGP